LLNAIVAGRDVHPVERYLDLWRRIAFDILWICIALSIAAVAAEILQRDHELGEPGVSAQMPAHRFVIANGAIAGMLLSFLFVHLSVRWGVGSPDPWPVSTFPMFSGIVSDPLSYFRLFGATSGPESKRFFLDGPALYPFDRSRLTRNFRVLSADEPRLERVLEHLGRRYNVRVAAGDLAGPVAECVELYAVELPLRKPIRDPLENIPPIPLARVCGLMTAP
jgi:hypothetical protein